MHRLAQSISPTLQAVFGTLRASLAAIGFSASRGPCLSLASPSTSRKAFSSLSPAFVSPLTALFTFVETTRVLYSLRSFFSCRHTHQRYRASLHSFRKPFSRDNQQTPRPTRHNTRNHRHHCPSQVKMLFRTATSVALLACAASVSAEPKPYRLAMMPVLGQSLARRSTNGYQPELSQCHDGDTCAEACGSEYTECASSGSETHCYNPSVKQSCCADGSGSMFNM